jgi:hypothetical protein
VLQVGSLLHIFVSRNWVSGSGLTAINLVTSKQVVARHLLKKELEMSLIKLDYLVCYIYLLKQV